MELTSIFSKKEALELKGIAIIMMLFHHCFRLKELYDGCTVSFFPFKEMSIVNTAHVSKICVSFFVFISGYGLFLSYENKKESSQKWVAKRYVKTFSGYWFIWLASALICQLINGRTREVFFSGGLAKGIVYCIINMAGVDGLFGTPSQNAVWWYMGAAVIYIITIPAIYKWKDNLWLFLAWGILMPRMFLRYNGADLLASGMSPFSFFIPLILGCAFARYNLFEKFRRYSMATKVYFFLIELWGIIFLYFIYLYMDRARFWEIHYGMFPVLCIVFLVEFIFPIKSIQKPLIVLGRHSMNIYLVHPLIQMYAGKLIYRGRHFLVVTIALIFVSLIVSIAIEWVKRLTHYNEHIIRLIYREQS